VFAQVLSYHERAIVDAIGPAPPATQSSFQTATVTYHLSLVTYHSYALSERTEAPAGIAT